MIMSRGHWRIHN